MQTQPLFHHPTTPLLALLTAVALLALPPAVRAQQTTIVYPEAVAHVDSSSPDRNYGKSKTLVIKSIAGGEAIAGARKAYLRFAIPPLPPEQVTGASLELVLNTVKWNKTDLELGVFFILYGLAEDLSTQEDTLGFDWDQEAITWNNAPSNRKDRGNSLRTLSDNPRYGGAFEIMEAQLTPDSKQGDALTFSSPELLAFVKEHLGQPINFAITRKNGHSDTDTMFASLENERYDPPTLVLQIKK